MTLVSTRDQRVCSNSLPEHFSKEDVHDAVAIIEAVKSHIHYCEHSCAKIKQAMLDSRKNKLQCENLKEAYKDALDEIVSIKADDDYIWALSVLSPQQS